MAVSQHRRNQTIDYQVARWMVLPAVILGIVAAVVAGEVGNEALRKVFGVVAVLVAIRMAVLTWRARAAASA